MQFFFGEVWVMPQHTFTTRSNLQTSHSFLNHSRTPVHRSRGDPGQISKARFPRKCNTWIPFEFSTWKKKSNKHMPRNRVFFCIVEMHPDWVLVARNPVWRWIHAAWLENRLNEITDQKSPSFPRSEVGGPQAFKSLHSFWVYSCNEEAALSH